MASSFKIDSLLADFAGELIFLKSIPPGIDEANCDPEEDIHLVERLLYDNLSPRLPKEIVSDNSDTKIESFSPFPIPIKDSDSLMEEINLSCTPDNLMSSGIEEDDYNSERDILIREELLDNYSLSLPENESFHFDIPSFSHPPAKPPDDKVVLIKKKLKAARDRQKSYADNRRTPLEFEVGDQVLLKVSPWKGVIHFRKKAKLAPKYVGPFEILKRKCLADVNLHVPLDEIRIDKTLHFVEEPVEIMDREVKSLKRSKIPIVKVNLNSKCGPEFT
uniref:Putative reverse transcriptase domain-containing protein n=1 Tax=Tanacetum cinerariifolium TaxID=118510 RepID=A0A6L2KPA4_TANCI|nr:putative reverse transcriptase domain-containing protein [Tanacetum cinerariifolium]